MVIGWTNQTLEAARAAHQGIEIREHRKQGNKHVYLVGWEGEAAYKQRCAPIVSARMSAGASNLAAALDAIWP
jgi:hypothetical protein